MYRARIGQLEARTPTAAVDPWDQARDRACAIVARRLNGEKVPKGDRLVLSFDDLEPTPAPLDDSGESHQAASLVLEGHRIKVVKSTGHGTCFDVALSIRSQDLKRQLATPKPAPEEFYGWSDDELILVDGRPYFLSEARAQRSIRVTGIGSDFRTALVCERERRHREPERVIEAVDKELCAAVAEGRVAPIAFGTKGSSDLSEEPGWSDYLDQEHLWLAARMVAVEGVADLDIANDGRLLHVAWLKNHDGSSGGCGSSWGREWPVIVDASGSPAADDPLNRAISNALGDT
jgi:hypothetical protein